MSPLIGIFRACTTHFQLQFLLATHMNIEIVGGLIEQFVIQKMTNVLHDEINMMKCTPNTHEFGLKLVINECYHTSMSANHCVFAIGVERNNVRLPTCI
jgi:hypothetical protein